MSYRVPFFLVMVSIFLGSCNAQKNYKNSGVIVHKFRMYDKKTRQFILPAYFKDIKNWYKDSLIIAEGLSVSIAENAQGKEIWKTTVGKYTFIDLRAKSFYVYAHFSDTAQIVKKYSLPDSGRVEGGFNFFDTAGPITSKSLRSISDTIIDGKTYSRLRGLDIIKTDTGQTESIQTAYLRCDIRNTIFSVDKLISKKTRCMVARIDDIHPFDQTGISIEMEYISNTLTPLEIKVFNAWEKNAKKNPINK